MSDAVLIVTRHKTLVEWLNKHGITGTVMEQVTPEDVRGKHVYGILPLWLAAEADVVTEVSMPGMPLEARKRVNGGDFSVDEMDEWGAEVRHFKVFTPESARCENSFCPIAYDGAFAKLSGA